MKKDVFNIIADSEAVMKLAQNRTLKEISNVAHLLQECIRNYFSRFLAHFDESNPLQCYIVIDIDESQGLSDSEKPHLVWMCQSQPEGIIVIQLEGCEHFELEDYPLDAQIDFIRAIENVKGEFKFKW